jgi:NAD-dependent DNA ligase
VFFYDILHLEGGPHFTDDMSLLDALREWGLHASPFARLCSTMEEVFAYHGELESRRDTLAYGIDGIVLKLDDLGARERLHATGRHPCWALAFKFTPREAETTIEDIVVQVGRTGILTPVAVLRPVHIGGVTVTRATLHNREDIARQDLCIGDTVRVVRLLDAAEAAAFEVFVTTDRHIRYQQNLLDRKIAIVVHSKVCRTRRSPISSRSRGRYESCRVSERAVRSRRSSSAATGHGPQRRSAVGPLSARPQYGHQLQRHGARSPLLPH